MRSIFGDHETMAQIGAGLGQFVILNKKYPLKAHSFDTKSSDDVKTLYLHHEFFNAISDEISEGCNSCVLIKANLDICLKLRLHVVKGNVEEDDSLNNFIKSTLQDVPVFENSVHLMNYFGQTLLVKVEPLSDLCEDLANLSFKASTPIRQIKSDPKLVSELTEVSFLANNHHTSLVKSPIFIGGLETETEAIYRAIKCLDSGQSYVGILLHGPSGSGKTLLAHSMMSTLTEFHQTQVVASDIFSQFAGETEQKLKRIVRTSPQHAKSLIFIDEFDVLASKGSSEQEKRVAACLKSLLDDLSSQDTSKVIVFACSSRPDVIDASFRRPGRLATEVELSVPTPSKRASIITALAKKLEIDLGEDEIRTLSQNAHGYVGADLEAVLSHLKNDGNLNKALKAVRPSAMREVQVQVPNVTWADIGGLDDLKLKLRQAVEWPIRHPEVFSKMGITPPKGVLMYGPPGCSKTMIAKALANESHLNFVAIKGPELFKKYVGESEQVGCILTVF